jgi:hypothetical protein
VDPIVDDARHRAAMAAMAAASVILPSARSWGAADGDDNQRELLFSLENGKGETKNSEGIQMDEAVGTEHRSALVPMKKVTSTL